MGRPDHAQAAEMPLTRGHAGRQRPYLHEELGPGGGVLHHSVHHTDESLTLTHLQQRREWMIRTQSHIRVSPPHPPMLVCRKQGKAVALGASRTLYLTSPSLALVNSVSGPALTLP
jgi:hypothetical protein